MKPPTISTRPPADARLLSMTISEVLWVVCFFALAFEVYLREFFAPFNYLDEAVTIFMAVLAVLKLTDHKKGAIFSSHEKKAFFLLLIFLLIGVLGNVFSGISVAPFAIGVDLFACSKFLLALLSGIVLFSKGSDRVLNGIVFFSKILVVILFVCSIVNLFFDVGFSNGSIRWGIRSFAFVFYHPTCVNVLCVALVALLATNCRRNWIFIVLCLVVMCLTLRTKGITFSAAVIALLLLMNNNNQVSWKVVLFAAVSATLLGYDQFTNYYFNGDEARMRLTAASISIANDYSPIGTGFATFASNITASPGHYSPLYYSYNLSTVWGLTPLDPKFVSDTFLPIVLGQFGWSGLLVFLLFIYQVIIGIYQRTKSKSSSDVVSVVLIFVYLIISSTAESAFFSNAAPLFAICLVLCASKSPNSDCLELDNRTR